MKLSLEELEPRVAPVSLPLVAALVAQEQVAEQTGGEAELLTNMQKQRHDAMMATIQNAR